MLSLQSQLIFFSFVNVILFKNLILNVAFKLYKNNSLGMTCEQMKNEDEKNAHKNKKNNV